MNAEIDRAREQAKRVAYPSKCLIPVEIEPGGRRHDLASYQTQPLGPERYDENLQKLVSIITRDYQLRHRERRS